MNIHRRFSFETKNVIFSFVLQFCYIVKIRFCNFFCQYSAFLFRAILETMVPSKYTIVKMIQFTDLYFSYFSRAGQNKKRVSHRSAATCQFVQLNHYPETNCRGTAGCTFLGQFYSIIYIVDIYITCTVMSI